MILEIRLRVSGLSMHSPALWDIPGSPKFYEVHVRGPLPSKTDGSLYPELPRRLAHSGTVRGKAVSPQVPPQQLGVPWINFAKSSLSPSQRTSFLGAVFNSFHMRVAVAPDRALTIQQPSKSEPYTLSKHFKRCWASWPLLLQYFSLAHSG